MVEVRLDAVSKVFPRSGGVAAVDNVDLTIYNGEFFTLLGPSGCGKTTTLRMVAGFYFPSDGRIFFGPDDVTRQAPNKRDTGMVFQNYALFPHLNVAQNVGYGLKVRKVRGLDGKRRISEALDQVHLGGFGERRVDELSGGQQQRVALARALVIRPRTLLLDEPLSNLDAKLREETRQEIRRIQQESATTSIYVTHDQAEAMAMSDRVAVMHNGAVQQVDTPEQIYRRPANQFVATFIGRSNVLTLPVTGVGQAHVDVLSPAGESLRAAAPGDHGLRESDSALVSVRPEHIQLAAPELPGAVPGRVIGTEFTGMATNVTVDMAGSQIEVAAVQTPTEVRPGDTVGVVLAPEHLWVVRP